VTVLYQIIDEMICGIQKQQWRDAARTYNRRNVLST